MREHDNEPIRGLPELLPAGERILWQGAPAWRALARRALHVGKVALYFSVLVAWNAVAALQDGRSVADVAIHTLWITWLPVSALTLLVALAYLYARTTVYTLTNKRLVIRSGVALPVTVNLPFTVIEGAGLRTHGGGIGDISLQLQKAHRVAYLALWPSVRPWHFGHPEPMLRCIPDASNVARIVAEALHAHAENRPPRVAPATGLAPSDRLTDGAPVHPLMAAGR